MIANTKNWLSRVSLRHWIFLILLLVITRMPSLWFPKALDDEQTYAAVAIEMMRGGQMYVDAVERKPPLLFWIYEVILSVFGPYNWLALHWVSVMWVLLSAFGLFLIGRNLRDDLTGWVMAMLYVCYQHWFHYTNLAFNGEMMMNLPIIWAYWLALRRPDRWQLPALLLSGMLICLAFLIKQPAAITAVPIGLYLLLPAYRKAHGFSIGSSIVQAAVFSVGFFGTLALVVAYLHNIGLLEDALFWTIGHHDIPHGPADPVFWIRGGRIGLAFMISCLPLTLGTYFSLKQASKHWGHQRPVLLCLILLLLVSVIGVAASGRFYPHYFIQLVLPMCILAALPVTDWLQQPSAEASSWWRRRRLLLRWIAFSLAVFMVAQIYDLWKRKDPLACSTEVRNLANDNDRLFVWGQKPLIYLETRLRPASRYIATFPLTGHLFGSPHTWDPNFDTAYNIVPGSWDQLEADFEKHPPRFIVDQDGARSVPRYPIRDYAYLRELLAREYRLVKKAADGIIYERVADPAQVD